MSEVVVWGREEQRELRRDSFKIVTRRNEVVKLRFSPPIKIIIHVL